MLDAGDRTARLFQSAPGHEARGNATRRAAFGRRCSFNPPPAMRPGETLAVEATSIARTFQSAPGHEARGNACAARRLRLDQFQSAPGHEARGNSGTTAGDAGCIMFQSAPGHEARGNAPGRMLVARSFNPPPAMRPGETRETIGKYAVMKQSFNTPRR